MKASFRDMILFVAAYEEHSFTAAAKREGSTQSGVSQCIAKLEAVSGVRLFTRSKAGIGATPAANAFYRNCIEILREFENGHRVLSDFGRGLNGRFCIGLMPTLTRCILAPALAAFIEAHPNVAVSIVEGYSGALTRQVASGELEFAIVPAFSGMSGVRGRHLLRTPEALVSRKAQRKPPQSVKLAQVGPLKLVVPGKDNARRPLLESYFTANAIKIDRTLELDAMIGTLALVAKTDWRAVLPAIMMADPQDRRVFDIQLIRDPAFNLDLVLIEAVRKPISRPAEVLLSLIKEEMDRFKPTVG
jgi:LysR family transcriptional regulator, nitrogen assimilation regulatory protein